MSDAPGLSDAMAFAVDLRAEALLLTVQETTGGDLRAAFVILCSRASLSDVTGEAYEAALGRAVRDLFRLPDVAFAGPITGDPPILPNFEPYKVTE
jgi:hypothetical protein